MKAFLLLTICAMPLLVGCGTLTTRALRSEFSDEFPPVYAAVYCDAGLLSAPCRPMDDVGAGKRTAMCVAGLFDLPISLAFDTLLLPYDIYVVSSH